MIFTTSDVSSLTVSLSRWEWAEYVSCALVAIGCGGEYIASFTNRFTGGVKEKKDRLAKRSTLLLISALALELVCLVKTNSISGMLIGSLSEKAEAADAKAHSAQIAAGEAKQKAGEVAKQADAIAGRLSKASEELSKVEHAVLVQGPRWRLLEDGKATVVEALKPFAGQRVTVVICGPGVSPPEQFRVEQDLWRFLGKEGAQWAVELPGYVAWERCASISNIGGFLIVSNAAASDGVKRAAKALEDVLNKFSMATSSMPALPLPEGQLQINFFGAYSPYAMAVKDPTAIFVVVGPNVMAEPRTNKTIRTIPAK